MAKKQKDLQKQLEQARKYHRKLDGMVIDLEAEQRQRQQSNPQLEAQIKKRKRKKLQMKDKIARLQTLLGVTGAKADAIPDMPELVPMAAE